MDDQRKKERKQKKRKYEHQPKMESKKKEKEERNKQDSTCHWDGTEEQNPAAVRWYCASSGPLFGGRHARWDV